MFKIIEIFQDSKTIFLIFLMKSNRIKSIRYFDSRNNNSLSHLRTHAYTIIYNPFVNPHDNILQSKLAHSKY
ncbi:unnamed protein product [Schistosoma intercalatum]|nr:unnamed protein product [Schistosoma intercalatum]